MHMRYCSWEIWATIIIDVECTICWKTDKTVCKWTSKSLKKKVRPDHFTYVVECQIRIFYYEHYLRQGRIEKETCCVFFTWARSSVTCWTVKRKSFLVVNRWMKLEMDSSIPKYISYYVKVPWTNEYIFI